MLSASGSFGATILSLKFTKCLPSGASGEMIAKVKRVCGYMIVEFESLRLCQRLYQNNISSIQTLVLRANTVGYFFRNQDYKSICRQYSTIIGEYYIGIVLENMQAMYQVLL